MRTREACLHQRSQPGRRFVSNPFLKQVAVDGLAPRNMTRLLYTEDQNRSEATNLPAGPGHYCVYRGLPPRANKLFDRIPPPTGTPVNLNSAGTCYGRSRKIQTRCDLIDQATCSGSEAGDYTGLFWLLGIAFWATAPPRVD